MDLLEEDDVPMDQAEAGGDSGAENVPFDSDTVKSPKDGESEKIVECPDPVAEQQEQEQQQNPPPQADPVVAPTVPDGPPELWVETKTESGKSYFYHSVTRETTWTRPDGRNVQILTQAELEQINAAKQMTPLVTPTTALSQAVVPGLDPVRRPPPVLFGAPPPRFAMPPPLGMPPPGFGAPTWMIPPATQPPPTNVLIDPAIVAKAAEWTEHKAPDGRT